MINPSKLEKDVFYERWDTPVKTADQLYLLAILNDDSYVHFFFERRCGETQERYELSVNSREAYRVTEEGMGRSCIGDLFNSKGPNDGIKNSKYRTYKFWNTAFAKNVYEGYALSEKSMEPGKTFHYMVVSQDEYIEFFTLTPPQWTRLDKGTKIADLIAGYLKKWGPDEE